MQSFLFIIRKHPVECVLILVAIIITSVIVFLYPSNTESPEVLAIHDEISTKKANDTSTFTIDISGAVVKPNVYKINSGSTLYDIIKKAGGFSKDADTDYISRNFNLAKGISDKEKVYIPTKDDIKNGLFTEKSILAETETTTTEPEELTTNGISVNTASLEELDTLSGVGPVTAQKIIDNRPYETIDELISKKAVNSTTFNKIKELISL